MANLSYQTYKELAIPYFKETFDIVDEVMSDHQVPYYLIGASAIDLEFHNDVFPEDDFDQRIIAAEVLGRRLRVSLISQRSYLSEFIRF